MASNLITTKELYNVRVMGGKNASKRIGKVRAFVYHPKERRCIGIMVKRPDLLWMFHRKDLFVSLDGFEFEDGRVVLADDAKTRDKAACKAIDVRLDDCVIWGGMPVVTESGATLGTVGVVTFSLVTGKVEWSIRGRRQTRFWARARSQAISCWGFGVASVARLRGNTRDRTRTPSSVPFW